MSYPKIVIIGGTTFLASEVLVEDNKVTCKDAFCVGESNGTVRKSALSGFLKAGVLDNLETLTVAGAGATYAERELSSKLKQDFKILEVQLEAAKENGPKELVAECFENMQVNG